MDSNFKYKLIRAVTSDVSLGLVEPLIPKLKENYNVQLISSPGPKLSRLCSDNDLKGYGVYMFRRISLLKDIRSLYHLVKIFQKEKPYIVHSMTPKAGLLCMLAAWITRVPRRVHTFTGLVWPTSKGIRRMLLMLTDWMTCFCCTHIIPEGKGVLDDLNQHITNKPMKVLGYGNVRGVDMIRFSRREEVMKRAAEIYQQDKFTFIFVGRLVADKGINELVAAFTTLNKLYPFTRLLLVGKYEVDLDPLEDRTIDEINHNGAIEYIGPKYAEDLLSYYAASDCFVLPSYREGFPNVVLEAGAMGLPCIVTNINGSREIIEEGKNGLIIPSKDIDALLCSMEKMIVDEKSRKYMVTNARQMIEYRFEQSFVQQCLLDFYSKIM